MPKYDDSLVLYANCVVAPNSEASPNTVALKNPYDLPMVIREIRFRVYPLTTDVDNPFQFRRVTGMSLGVKLDMGDISLVDSQVPVSSFGTVRDAADYSAQSPSLGANAAPLVATQLAVYTDDAGDTQASPVTYSWRLKYPIYVPPGAVVTPVFNHLGQTHLSLNVDVLYVANTLPRDFRPPKQVMMPWVGSFNSRAFDNYLGAPAGREFSSELDLVNPFRVPLEVARLTGLLALNYNSATATGDVVEDWGSHRQTLGFLKARSSQGDELARVSTIYSTLFPYTWRVWDIPGSWWLSPGDYYKLQLDVSEVQNATDDAQQGRDQYMVALTGYRPVDTVAVHSAGVQS